MTDDFTIRDNLLAAHVRALARALHLRPYQVIECILGDWLALARARDIVLGLDRPLVLPEFGKHGATPEAVELPTGQERLDLATERHVAALLQTANRGKPRAPIPDDNLEELRRLNEPAGEQ